MDPPINEESIQCEPKQEPFIDYYQQWHHYNQDQPYQQYWNGQEYSPGWNNSENYNYGNNQFYGNSFILQQPANEYNVPGGWSNHQNEWKRQNALPVWIDSNSSMHETSYLESSNVMDLSINNSNTTQEWDQTSATINGVQSNTDDMNQTSDLGSSINLTNDENSSLNDLEKITGNQEGMIENRKSKTSDLVSSLKDHPKEEENSQNGSVSFGDSIVASEGRNVPQGKVAPLTKYHPKLVKKSRKIHLRYVMVAPLMKDHPKLKKKSKKIKSSKSKEIWISDHSLPSGWKKKSYEWNRKGKIAIRYSYMSPTNQNFASMKDVIKFMKGLGTYSEDDLKKIISEKKAGFKKKQRKLNILQQQKKNAKHNNNSNGQYINFCIDDTLPSGWKKKELKNGKFNVCHFLSPENLLYKTRKAVINFMKSTNIYSNEDLQKFQSSRKSSGYGKWYSNNDILPNGWKMRESKQTVQKHGKFRVQYMNPTSQIFKTKRSALSHIKNLGTYSDSDVQKFHQGTKNQHPKINKNQSQKKITSERPSKKKINFSEWMTDDATLPSGWKKKELKSGKLNICHFLSPENVRYKTRKAVLKCMKSTNNYSNEDLQKFQSSRKSKHYEEWCSNNEVLPTGWKLRKLKQNIQNTGKFKQSKVQYMNSTGQIFKTNRSAIFHIKSLGTYSESDIQKFIQNIKTHHPKPSKKQLQKKTCKRSSKKKINYSDWMKDDEMLPTGWLKRSYETKLTGDIKNIKYQYFCGTTNRIFKCTTAVLYFMKESRIYSADDRKKFVAAKKKQISKIKVTK